MIFVILEKMKFKRYELDKKNLLNLWKCFYIYFVGLLFIIVECYGFLLIICIFI